jgi:hypothetical protein
MGTTTGAGTIYTSVAPQFTPVVVAFVLQNLYFSVRCFIDYCFSFCSFVLFLLAIALSVLRITASDIFKFDVYLIQIYMINIVSYLLDEDTSSFLWFYILLNKNLSSRYTWYTTQRPHVYIPPFLFFFLCGAFFWVEFVLYIFFFFCLVRYLIIFLLCLAYPILPMSLACTIIATTARRTCTNYSRTKKT